MSSIENRPTFWSLAIAGLLFVATGVRSNAATIPEDVRQALQLNAESLDPIQITWTTRRVSNLPRARLLKTLRLPEKSREFFHPTTVKFKWQDGRIYSSRSGKREVQLMDGDKSRVQDSELILEREFNGEKVYTGNKYAANDNSLLLIQWGERVSASKPDSQFAEDAYFREAGFRMPLNGAEITQSSVPKSLVLYLADQRFASVTAVESQPVDGNDCLMVELTEYDRVHRFYLDPALHYAVRRREELSKDRAVVRRADHNGFVQVGSTNLWLPRTSAVAHHSYENIPETFTSEPLFVEKTTVSEISDAPVPAELFVLAYDKPGTWVTDQTVESAEEGDGISYQVPANASDLDAAIAAARERVAGQPTVSAWRISLLVLNVAVVMVVVLIIIMRRVALSKG